MRPRKLYENYGVPDNYTDSTFLGQLQKNIKANNRNLLEAVQLGSHVSLQLNIIVLIVIIFIWLKNDWTTPHIVFMFSVISTVIGYITFNVTTSNRLYELRTDLRTVVIFLLFGYILSPVLYTLTETISTDTIYTMTILMFIVHLIFGKYGLSQISLSNSLSMTSSIFGSLMLASRLSSHLHAFSLLTVSVEFFVLLPLLLIQWRNKLFISIPLAIGTTISLYFVSQFFSFLFVIAISFIQFVCPCHYIKSQKYKDNIYGPWDEAIITSSISCKNH